ncbi:unnamed protein product [Paramecium sonneborni]|uniref:OTU domain-containing protein n=1 Tax=Paramecium sonneborni TaxID=65129 RepID=A0A8S1KND6_9CILI|nr:unnamed protein product [Paramecium sonneborni]
MLDEFQGYLEPIQNKNFLDYCFCFIMGILILALFIYHWKTKNDIGSLYSLINKSIPQKIEQTNQTNLNTKNGHRNIQDDKKNNIQNQKNSSIQKKEIKEIEDKIKDNNMQQIEKKISSLKKQLEDIINQNKKLNEELDNLKQKEIQNLQKQSNEIQQEVNQMKQQIDMQINNKQLQQVGVQQKIDNLTTQQDQFYIDINQIKEKLNNQFHQPEILKIINEQIKIQKDITEIQGEVKQHKQSIQKLENDNKDSLPQPLQSLQPPKPPQPPQPPQQPQPLQPPEPPQPLQPPQPQQPQQPQQPPQPPQPPQPLQPPQPPQPPQPLQPQQPPQPLQPPQPPQPLQPQQPPQPPQPPQPLQPQQLPNPTPPQPPQPPQQPQPLQPPQPPQPPQQPQPLQSLQPSQPPQPPQPLPNNQTIVSNLYNLTSKTRQVQQQYRAFVGDFMDQNALITEYGMKKKENKDKLKEHLIGMRNARGDGNCFYTSFVFQYLDFMINTTDQQFQELIQQINMLKFQVTFQRQNFNQSEFNELQKKFKAMCEYLRKQKIENRIQQFYDYFKDDDNEFYGLSIIFLRNLAYKFCIEDELISSLFVAQGLDLEQQLLEWEYDCEYNEGVINLLSEKLNISTMQFICDSKTNSIKIINFNQDQNTKLSIYLLFRPGHYNIGVPKQH